MSTAEKRVSPRAHARFETGFSSERLEGSGVLCNFSSTGALVEEATEKPRVDSDLFLYVPLDGGRSFKARGSVVRHTETGFAIEYEKDPTDLQQLLEAAGAVALVTPE